MFYVLDTYLNTPDKFLNETPLHFASKFGSVEIVQLLVSYPECDRERKNNKGETPADVSLSPKKVKADFYERYIFSDHMLIL